MAKTTRTAVVYRRRGIALSSRAFSPTSITSPFLSQAYCPFRLLDLLCTQDPPFLTARSDGARSLGLKGVSDCGGVGGYLRSQLSRSEKDETLSSEEVMISETFG